MTETLAGATKSALIATAELDPDYFGKRAIRRLLNEKLSQGIKLQVLFGKRSARTANDAFAQLLDEKCPLIELEEAFPAQLQLYWSPRPVQQAFLVVDDRDCLVTNDDQRADETAATLWRDDPRTADKWTGVFAEQRATAAPIGLSHHLRKISPALLRLWAAWHLLIEAIKHPLIKSYITIDADMGRVTAYRSKRRRR